MELLKKCAKGGLAFALAGVAIALLLPAVCSFLGFSAPYVAHVAATQTVPWCATFFGMIGATQPLAIATVGAVWPDNKEVDVVRSPLEARTQTPSLPAPQHEYAQASSLATDRGKAAGAIPTTHITEANPSEMMQTTKQTGHNPQLQAFL